MNTATGSTDEYKYILKFCNASKIDKHSLSTLEELTFWKLYKEISNKVVERPGEYDFDLFKGLLACFIPANFHFFFKRQVKASGIEETFKQNIR